MLLDKSAILAADDLPCDEVAVPEWGGDVRLKMLNGAQREAIEIRMHKCRSADATTATAAWRGLKNYMLACALVDESGTPLFSEKEMGELGKKNGSVIERLYNYVLKQNAFSSEEHEELAKN